ncbi:hypothetical protein ACFL27_13880 [candidate division CSSED10-310 bacterium]|uniref:AAA+ ATPase domain-containing protein n=1 Tax=candidate division CSSED10-310 bacterium TaxID=2855610 RepID=A0ABV6YYY8_UNCC1
MIQLDVNYHDDSVSVNLDHQLIKSLPQPIAALLQHIEENREPQLQLQQLCLSLIPMTFQYLALILGSEYLHSEDPPDMDITDTLINMIRRPGPGKWVGFIRTVTAFFKNYAPHVIPRSAIEALSSTLVSKKRPRVSIIENAKTTKRIDYYEALINIRNRFAHTRQIPPALAGELVHDFLLVWKALITLLNPVFAVRIYFLNKEKMQYIPFDQREYDPDLLKPEPTDSASSMILRNDQSGAFDTLIPLIILFPEQDLGDNEILLLEEMKGKNLLYLFRDSVVKKKEEYRILIEKIENRTIKENRVSSIELTTSILGQRIDRATRRAINGFIDTQKYMPTLFIERESVSIHLNNWVESEKPGAILLGKSGTGKTSLVANWCLQRQERGDHVLLLEASKLPHSDLSVLIQEILLLDSPLRKCLESIHHQNKDKKTQQDVTRFIIIIDAINEFSGAEFDNRSILWREINSLVERFQDYESTFKCLVTSRSDVWQSDFHKGNSPDLFLKRRLYYGDNDQGFPIISIVTFSAVETEKMYEKSRSSNSGMAPLTSFQQLPARTRETIHNPFLLRLTLQTFNDLPVPALSERKLIKIYTHEKLLEEQKKKEILFHLLDRMAELNKTEISLEEFLNRKKQSKRKKIRIDQGLQNLDEIIFDPRPKSPYKRLLIDGLIEERSVQDQDGTSERLSFAQEKITHLLNDEKNKKIMKKAFMSSLIILLGFGIFTVLIFLLLNAIAGAKFTVEKRATADFADNADF